MWIFNSSIGRKLIMSISGLFLVIFLALHGTINLLAVYDALHISADGVPGTNLYNEAAHFMSTNLLVQIMVPILALGFIVHIIYACVLTLQNRKARGRDRYAVRSKTKIDWASQNMFILGVIIIGFIALHLTHFWAKMQLQEWLGNESAEGYQLVVQTFSCPTIAILMLVWLVALWFHLNHGFWSALQTLGWNNSLWYHRLRVIGTIVTTLVLLTFVIVVVYFGFIYQGPDSIMNAYTATVAGSPL